MFQFYKCFFKVIAQPVINHDLSYSDIYIGCYPTEVGSPIEGGRRTPAALAALGAGNSIGTWKANTAASKHTPAPWPVKSLTVLREAVPGGVKVTNSGEQMDGTAINASYTAMYDGTAVVATGQGTPWAVREIGFFR